MRFAQRLVAAAALGLPFACHADPDEYVNTPSVEYGEREFDFKYGTARVNDLDQRASASSLGVGYGATPWWFTEAYLKVHKEPGDRTRYDAFEWENKFQLTEPNRYPVDVGLLTEIEIPKEHAIEGYELKVGPLFQFDTGALRWNANLFLQRSIRGAADEPRVTELSYQLQAAYHLAHGLDVGAQAFGEMGQWDHWVPSDEQTHRIGPAVFGKVKLAGRAAIVYNAAWLIGAAKGAPDNTLRVQVEYEF